MSRERLLPGQESIPQRYFEPLDKNTGSVEQPGVFSLAEKLVSTWHAHQDFARAIDIANRLRFDFAKLYAFVGIGKAQAEAGFDTSSTVDALIDIANRPRGVTPENVYQGITSIHLAAGKFEEAEMVLLTSPYTQHDRSFQLELAIAKARFGHDPLPILDEIKKTTERDEVPDSSIIKLYAELAKTHFRATEEYPQNYLLNAKRRLEGYQGKYPNDIHIPGFYMDIANAYATCGNFQSALELTEKISGYNPINESQLKLRVYGHIAREQFERGFYQDAIISAQLAIRTIDTAEANPPYLKGHLLHAQEIEGVKLLAVIAKAKNLSGQDGADEFKVALDRTSRITANGYWKADVLIEIAKSQEAAGIDSKPVLDRALHELDVMPTAKEYDGYIDFEQQLLGYEELAKAQATLDKIYDAKVTLGRLERRFATMEDELGIVPEVLSVIALAEAKKGLKPQEIASLSSYDIKTILSSSSEKAKQALTYFGIKVSATQTVQKLN